MPGSQSNEVRQRLGRAKSVRVTSEVTHGPAQGLRLKIEAARGVNGSAAAGGSSQLLAAASRGEGRGGLAHLTYRETQVLKMIARGLHNRQIAARIHRSVKTVEKHRQNLNQKLSVHEVAGLTRYALRAGLAVKRQQDLARAARKPKHLTPREIQILKLVAEGLGNKWIADSLHRSIKTIDHHRENLMKKLNIHEVAGLTRYAVGLGLM